jgi:hypothetical protein
MAASVANLLTTPPVPCPPRGPVRDRSFTELTVDIRDIDYLLAQIRSHGMTGTLTVNYYRGMPKGTATLRKEIDSLENKT